MFSPWVGGEWAHPGDFVIFFVETGQIPLPGDTPNSQSPHPGKSQVVKTIRQMGKQVEEENYLQLFNINFTKSFLTKKSKLNKQHLHRSWTCAVLKWTANILWLISITVWWTFSYDHLNKTLDSLIKKKVDLNWQTLSYSTSWVFTLLKSSYQALALSGPFQDGRLTSNYQALSKVFPRWQNTSPWASSGC